MSHYPTSAELADMRGHPSHDPVMRWERVYGTVREAGQRDFASDPAAYTLARREASRMRSRTYYRLSHDPTTEPALPVLDLLHPDGAYFGPWYEETSYGAPYTWNVCECCGNPHTYCDCYGIAV